MGEAPKRGIEVLEIVDRAIEHGLARGQARGRRLPMVRLPGGVRPRRRAPHPPQGPEDLRRSRRAEEDAVKPLDAAQRSRIEENRELIATRARQDADCRSRRRHRQDHRARRPHRRADRAPARHHRPDRGGHVQRKGRRRAEAAPARRARARAAKRPRRFGRRPPARRRRARLRRSAGQHDPRLLRRAAARTAGGSARRSGVCGADRHAGGTRLRRSVFVVAARAARQSAGRRAAFVAAARQVALRRRNRRRPDRAFARRGPQPARVARSPGAVAAARRTTARRDQGADRAAQGVCRSDRASRSSATTASPCRWRAARTTSTDIERQRRMVGDMVPEGVWDGWEAALVGARRRPGFCESEEGDRAPRSRSA